MQDVRVYRNGATSCLAEVKSMVSSCFCFEASRFISRISQHYRDQRPKRRRYHVESSDTAMREPKKADSV